MTWRIKMTNEFHNLEMYKKYGYDIKDVPYLGMEIGDSNEFAINPYTEVKVELNPVEIAIFDVLMGCYQMHLMAGEAGDHEGAKELYNDYYKGKDWFIENNVDAYFDLID